MNMATDRKPVVDDITEMFGDVLAERNALRAEVEQSRKIIEAGRTFFKESVEPLRQLAMDISLKYEPCGYYCDEDYGHVDHNLCNQAKYLFGSGLEDYLPIELDPFPERRADQQTGRF